MGLTTISVLTSRPRRIECSFEMVQVTMVPELERILRLHSLETNAAISISVSTLVDHPTQSLYLLMACLEVRHPLHICIIGRHDRLRICRALSPGVMSSTMCRDRLSQRMHRESCGIRVWSWNNNAACRRDRTLDYRTRRAIIFVVSPLSELRWRSELIPKIAMYSILCMRQMNTGFRERYL